MDGQVGYNHNLALLFPRVLKRYYQGQSVCMSFFAGRAELTYRKEVSWMLPVSARAGHWLVSVEGRVDGANARKFQKAVETVIEDSDRAVVLDMENLSYISSAGLRSILLIAKGLQKRDSRLQCALSRTPSVKCSGSLALTRSSRSTPSQGRRRLRTWWLTLPPQLLAYESTLQDPRGG